MRYYYDKIIPSTFEDVVNRVKQALKSEGFGVLTEIDVKETLARKLEVDFRNYRILGACNPPFAHKALLAEDKIGTMLPCNVIVQETPHGEVEIAAIDPVASMKAIDNAGLKEIAETIGERLKHVIQSA